MGYHNTRAGCWLIVHLREDNIRFLLLAIVMIIYMLVGAAVFMGLERKNELQEKREFKELLENFTSDNPGMNKTQLMQILKLYADIGHTMGKRPRWDYAGSFYFVGTVVSTIGFGMTTPRTVAGKVCLILYGFLGCAGAILFFNLFLERIITFLAYILRSLHERELRRKGLLAPRDGRRGSHTSEESLDDWKPSVYWVMLILFISAVVIACCASAMYSPVEEEMTYFDAFYFSFVAFATIGFGDYIVSQHDSYKNTNAHLYRMGNFIFIVLGCCCVYSLFNVTSIVIKQFLNWLIRRMDCRCCYKKKPVVRRNAITPGSNLAKSRSRSLDLAEIDSTYDSDPERRGSGEMISMTDFLKSNKITLAMMQKQLHESANRQQTSQQNGSGFQGGCGPLAILNKKLGQDEV